MACRVEYAAMTDRDRLIARVLKAAAVFELAGEPPLKAIRKAIDADPEAASSRETLTHETTDQRGDLTNGRDQDRCRRTKRRH